MFEDQRINAIASQKGGVGKTTTAVNISAFLGHYGLKTLLIDMDPQCNATAGIGIDYKSCPHSIYDCLVSNDNPSRSIMQTDYENLDVIPSNWDLSKAEEELLTINGRQFRLKESLSMIKKEYEFIIIDCPANLGILTRNALTAASEVIVPIQCEFYSIEGTNRLVEEIENVQLRFNFDLKILGFLVTMKSRTRIASQCLHKIEQHFINMTFQSNIPRNTALSECASFGMPILYFDKRSAGANAYQDMTVEIIENNIIKNNTDFDRMPKRAIRFWDDKDKKSKSIVKKSLFKSSRR